MSMDSIAARTEAEHSYEQFKNSINKPYSKPYQKSYSCQELCGRLSCCGNKHCSNYRAPRKPVKI